MFRSTSRRSKLGSHSIQPPSRYADWTLDTAVQCRIDSFRNLTLTPQVRRRVGPEQIARITLVTSGEKTDARNAGNRIAVSVSNFRALATSACVRSGSDRTALAPGEAWERRKAM